MVGLGVISEPVGVDPWSAEVWEVRRHWIDRTEQPDAAAPGSTKPALAQARVGFPSPLTAHQGACTMIEYKEGMLVSWIPMYWRWDTPKLLTVRRLYGRGEALLSNGVIVDRHGESLIYRNRPVGMVRGLVTDL